MDLNTVTEIRRPRERTELPLWQASGHSRTGPAQWLAEFVATFGLLLIVQGHERPRDAPWMVAAWIGAAYWFTASTSFANPAITIARSLSDTFSGILYAHAHSIGIRRFNFHGHLRAALAVSHRIVQQIQPDQLQVVRIDAQLNW